jgi:hypothetical protein
MLAFASMTRAREGSAPEFSYLVALSTDLLHDREGEVGDGVGAAHHGMLTAVGQRLHPVRDERIEFGDRDRPSRNRSALPASPSISALVNTPWR